MMFTEQEISFNEQQKNEVLNDPLSIRLGVPNLYDNSIKKLESQSRRYFESYGVDTSLMTARILRFLVHPSPRLNTLRGAFPTENMPELAGEDKVEFPKYYNHSTNLKEGVKGITPGVGTDDITPTPSGKLVTVSRDVFRLSQMQVFEDKMLKFMNKSQQATTMILNYFKDMFLARYEAFLMGVAPYGDSTADYSNGLLSSSFYTQLKGKAVNNVRGVALANAGQANFICLQGKDEDGKAGEAANNLDIAGGYKDFGITGINDANYKVLDDGEDDLNKKLHHLNQFFISVVSFLRRRLGQLTTTGYTAIVPSKVYEHLSFKISNSTEYISSMQNLRQQLGLRFITSPLFDERENGDIVVFANDQGLIKNVITEDYTTRFYKDPLNDKLTMKVTQGLTGLFLLNPFCILRVTNLY